MRNYKSILILFGVLTVFFYSCDKDDPVTENNQSVADFVFFTSEINDIVYLTEDALKDFDSRMRISANDCKTIVHYTDLKQIVIDFGNNSCVLEDGRARSGKIVIDYTDKYRTANSRISITLDNYFTGTTKLRGKINIKNSGNDKYEISVDNLRFPIAEEDSAKISGSFTKTWVLGQSTNTLDDDQYKMEGSVTGIDRKEQDFTANIVSPLMINYPCFEDGYTFPIEGIVNIYTENFADREVDYGQTDCDKNIILTIDGDSETVRY
jgi:hypothetical protein